MRRRRVRAVVRWVCTLAAMLVLGAAVFSLFRTATYVSVSRNGKNAWGLEVASGHLVSWKVVSNEMMGFDLSRGLQVSRPSPWSWGMSGDNGLIARWYGGFLWSWIDGATALHLVGVTLLYPFLLTAAPAAFLWYADRSRSGPGQCASCGYDRRGLAPAAACPECGTVPAA